MKEAIVDSAGRVVIPKKLRERLGLRCGRAVEIDEADGHVVIRAKRRRDLLEEVDGVLVFCGTTNEELSDVLERIREQRLDDLGISE